MILSIIGECLMEISSWESQDLSDSSMELESMPQLSTLEKTPFI